MSQKLPADIFTNQRRANWVSFALILAMVVCLSVTITQLLKWLTHSMTGLQWDFLPYLAFLVALESIFTRPVVRELEGRERWIYHFAEWVTFAVLLKVLLYFVHGFQNLPADLPRWQENILTFFEGEYPFSLIMIAVVWLLGRALANDIEDLNIDPTDVDWEFGKLQNSRSSVRSRLVGRVLWTGIVMVILATGVRASIAVTLGQTAVQEPVANIVLYFFLTLILFSQTQYALLSGRWFWQQTPTTGALSQSWLRYGLSLFALLAIISFLLPTNYSLGLLETLNFLLSWTVAALMFVVQLILLPIIWLLSLVGCTRQSPDSVPESAAPPSPFSLQPPAAPIPWLELLQAVLFWGVFVGIIGYALVQFVRQNPQIAGLFKRIPLLAWLGSLWYWLSGWLKGASTQVVEVFKDARQRLFPVRSDSLSRQVRGWLNFRQLNPRQQIVFYYLRLIERGNQVGLKRKAAETPYQYARALEDNLPEVQEDIAGLTETFLEARYSLHPIGDDHTSLVQRFWRNITRSLRRLRKPEK